MNAAIGDAGLTFRRCGVSTPTLRLWARRLRADGLAGLVGADPTLLFLVPFRLGVRGY